jgi:hypothetical protein
LNDQLAQGYAEAVYFGRPIPSYSLSAWPGTTLQAAVLWNEQRREMLEVEKRDCAADANGLALRRPTPHETRWSEVRLRCRCLHSCPRIAIEANCSRRAELRKDLKYFDGLTPKLTRRTWTHDFRSYTRRSR